jgi:hypothetical protein
MMRNSIQIAFSIPVIVAVLLSVSMPMATIPVFGQGTEEEETQQETGQATEEEETQQETGTEQIFEAVLSGGNEVPPTESNASGTAEFEASTGDEDGSGDQQVAFSVNLTGFDDITAAHIHSGNEGENGPIVATLSQGAEADEDSDQLQLNGEITTNDLEGPLEDMEILDLLDSMSNGSAYVNVHTELYPDGAVRGQIAPAGSPPSVNVSSSEEESSPSVP